MSNVLWSRACPLFLYTHLQQAGLQCLLPAGVKLLISSLCWSIELVFVCLVVVQALRFCRHLAQFGLKVSITLKKGNTETDLEKFKSLKMSRCKPGMTLITALGSRVSSVPIQKDLISKNKIAQPRVRVQRERGRRVASAVNLCAAVVVTWYSSSQPQSLKEGRGSLKEGSGCWKEENATVFSAVLACVPRLHFAGLEGLAVCYRKLAYRHIFHVTDI